MKVLVRDIAQAVGVTLTTLLQYTGHYSLFKYISGGKREQKTFDLTTESYGALHTYFMLKNKRNEAEKLKQFTLKEFKNARPIRKKS